MSNTASAALSMGAILCQNPTSLAEYYSYWNIYYPDCNNVFFLCNAGAGAYLPAITACYQGLSSTPVGLSSNYFTYNS
jgi:hypothetical protein